MFRNRKCRVFMNILIALGLVIMFSACATEKTAIVEKPPEVKQEAVEKKKAAPEKIAVAVEQKPGVEAKPSSEREAIAEKKEEAAKEAMERKLVLKNEHIVKNGECLWWIAQYRDLYDDPFLWPVIFDANKNKINNPNLIYPGQKLEIPRKGYTMEAIKEVRKKAGARKPYIPPKDANVPLD